MSLGGQEVVPPILPAGAVVDVTARVCQDVLAPGVNLHMARVVVGVRADLTTLELDAVYMEVAVLRTPACAHNIDTRRDVLVVALCRRCALFARGGHKTEVLATRFLVPGTEVRTHLVQIVGVECQVHPLVQRGIAAAGRQIIPIRVADHRRGQVGLDQTHNKLCGFFQRWLHVGRHRDAIQLAQTVTLEVDARSHHVVDGGALHVDAVIIEGVLYFLHDPSVAGHEPVGFDFREENAAFQQCAAFHRQPVGRLLVVAVMGHQEICMVTQQRQECYPSLSIPRRRGAERLHTGQPDRVDAHGRFDGAPGVAGEFVLGRSVLFIFHEGGHRPCFAPLGHFMQEFFRILFIFGQRISARQRLPINVAIQRPCPLVIVGGMLRRVEEPVDLAVKLVTIDIMIQRLLRILEDAIDLTLLHLLGGKEILRRCACAEMLNNRIHCAVRVPLCIAHLCVFQPGQIIIDPFQQLCHFVHNLVSTP